MFLHSSLKGLLYSSCFTLAILTSCSKSEDEDDPKVTAREDLYINEAYASDGSDWLEIFNNADTEKDIGGYKVYDDVSNKYTLPSNTIVPAKGFIILFCDDGATGLHTSFKLSSGGETVYLENKSGDVVDKMIFPSLEDGQSFARFPDGGTTQGITGTPTEGYSNGINGAPAIAEVIRTPLVPTKAQSVEIRAQLLSNAGVTSVKLYYRKDGGAFSTVNMTLNENGYVGTIPAANALGTIEYYVQATNSTSQSSVSPYEAPEKTYKYLLNEDVLPLLKINEFMAFNSSCCPDDDSGTPEFDDWVEIYNADDEPIDIAGYYLSDNKANPFNSKIGDGDAATIIPPGGFLIIWADGNGSQGDLHLDFSLAAEGEDVGLYYKDGRKIDEYTFSQQKENKSWGRTTNGGTIWGEFAVPTPGSSNE